MPVPSWHVRACAQCLTCSSAHGRIAQPLDTPHRRLWNRGRVSHEIADGRGITPSNWTLFCAKKRDNQVVGFKHHVSLIISALGRTEGWEMLLPKAGWRQNSFMKSAGFKEWTFSKVKKKFLVFWTSFSWISLKEKERILKLIGCSYWSLKTLNFHPGNTSVPEYLFSVWESWQ